MQKPTNCLGVFDQFMGLPLKGLTIHFFLPEIMILYELFCGNFKYRRIIQCFQSSPNVMKNDL